MKKLVCIIFITIAACNTSSPSDGSIGEIKEDGSFTLYGNVNDSLKNAWSKLLKSNKISSSVNEIKVVRKNDLDSKKEFLGVLGVTENDSAKIFCRITSKGSRIYFEDGESFSAVICHGSSNCIPEQFKGRWVCDDGTRSETCTIACNKISVAVLKNP